MNNKQLLAGIDEQLAQLLPQRDRLTAEIERLQQARKLLGGLESAASTSALRTQIGVPADASMPTQVLSLDMLRVQKSGRKGITMSPEARQRVAAAQRKRWEKHREQKAAAKATKPAKKSAKR